jgi:hypothetical protein
MGRSYFKWRNFACLPMIVILPVTLLADDTAAAMLRSNGGVLVNGSSVPNSVALFRDDRIETQKGAAARIEVAGSTADINPETVLQFDGDELVLEHGSVSVNTSRVMRVRVGCITVTPVNSDWTHYDVVDTDGKVTVSALKSDVYIDAKSKNPQEAKQPERSSRTLVKESERKSREEKCGAADIKWNSIYAGRGALLNSPWAIGGGAVAIGGVVCWVFCFNNDEPVSPSQP